MNWPTHSDKHWSIGDALEVYGVKRWGGGYFSINDQGNVVVTPCGDDGGNIDLKALVDEVDRRGIQLPVLLRFSDILRSRIELLNRAFANAIGEYEYKGKFRGVYPIKVNQSHRVVKEIIEFGREYNYGLEAGSKPELLATMALHEDPDALIVCNGYKDDDYIETALLTSRLDRTVIVVIEKLSELDHVHAVAERLGITPTLGVRAKLTSRGAGRWEQSGGDRSKFGLTAAELIEAVDKLRGWGELDSLKLLHFHLGSQISAIRAIKDALREAGRLFVELHELGAALEYFDVGGGLGVDYDGSQTNYASSINYSVQEYANDVVFAIQELCDLNKVPHPTVVIESGRAVSAHHSVLVVDVVGVNKIGTGDDPGEPPAEREGLLRNLHDTYELTSARNLRESYHDALEYKEQVSQLFNLGHLSLEKRVLCERVFWAICNKVLLISKEMSRLPDELEGLQDRLSDTYFCNFSIFQSLPDAWAIGHLFPIVPIHRLDELPTRRGVLADITCDSDGRIDSFIDNRDVKRVLELHDKRSDDRYQLGIFLVGAYQEILGDIHNLFGDQNTIHVSIDKEGGYSIDEVVAGDTVAEVLSYVGYTTADLVSKLRKHVEVGLRRKTITLDESRQLIKKFQEGLTAYTYLDT
jgi:arginine decarboxylase